VTLLCRGSRVGRGIGRSSRWAVLDELRRAGVRWRTGVSYERIAAEGVYVRGEDGARLVPADTVVIAAGQEAHDPLSGALARLGVPHRVVGGARGAEGLDAVRAFSEGLRAAYELGTAAPAPARAAG
jgi:2,4-dienoyl-CoA reductase (NADPH2)